MSQANIPNITPTISITRDDVINLLLASIAMEEIGLSHVINAEGEKIQRFLEVLSLDENEANILDQLLVVNQSVQSTLESIIQKEMFLQTKLANVFHLLDQ